MNQDPKIDMEAVAIYVILSFIGIVYILNQNLEATTSIKFTVYAIGGIISIVFLKSFIRFLISIWSFNKNIVLGLIFALGIIIISTIIIGSNYSIGLFYLLLIGLLIFYALYMLIRIFCGLDRFIKHIANH